MTLIRRVAPSLIVLLLDILYLLVVLLFLRRLRNNILFSGTLPGQSIYPWLLLCMNSRGSINFFEIFESPFLGLYLSTVTVRLLSVLLLISSFMNARNTSRSISLMLFQFGFICPGYLRSVIKPADVFNKALQLSHFHF